MTRDEIIELVRDALGFNTSLKEEIILRHMDRVQEKYETGHDNMPLPWFCLATQTKAYAVEGIRTADLPKKFVSFDEDWPVLITDEDDVDHLLTRRPINELKPFEAEVGFPSCFEIDGACFHLYPKPDADYDLTFACYIQLGKLSVTDDSPWFTNFSDLIIEETTFSIAKSTRDKGFMQTTDVKAKRDACVKRVEARKHTLVQYQVGGSSA